MTSALDWHLLTRPAGIPGSGRARYAAAMTLHAAGALSAAQLEAYREASTSDDRDPALTLADRWLAVPAPRPLAPDDLLLLLLVECDRLLAATAGAGVAEVRHALAPAFSQQSRPRPGPVNPLVAAHLPAALAALASADAALCSAIAGAAPHLSWITYDAYDPAEIGPDFPHGHAFASLVGEDAPFAARDFDLGLFLIAPRLLYRDHAHAAPELYLPLTGPHQWRFRPGGSFRSLPAFAPVWNPPEQPHATLTGDIPLLCLFAWTRNVNLPARILPADDWARYEGGR